MPSTRETILSALTAQLRRSRPAAAGARLEFEDIVPDGETHRVTRDDTEVKLGSTEFRLLSNLMERPGRVLSREQPLDRVWGRDMHVGCLRNALGQGDRMRPDIIRTVRGAGYALG